MKKESNPPPPVDERLHGRVAVSLSEIKRAFTEWDRRYREEPERFMSEAQHLLKETPETYGDACAPYFMQLVNEVKSGKIA
ncbi:MAG: hypothetical protein VR65_24945 [Desulfobulbaceae bacterium BRH_c16a]|nr:MAG: hypothetical protein VR65_24945 [Desulfobulbaceae bacterium BRH_c16a]